MTYAWLFTEKGVRQDSYNIMIRLDKKKKTSNITKLGYIYFH